MKRDHTVSVLWTRILILLFAELLKGPKCRCKIVIQDDFGKVACLRKFIHALHHFSSTSLVPRFYKYFTDSDQIPYVTKLFGGFTIGKWQRWGHGSEFVAVDKPPRNRSVL